MRTRTLLLGAVLTLSMAALLPVARASASRPRMPARPQAAPAAQRTPDDDLVAMADDVAKEVEALRGWTFKQPVKKELTSVPETMRYLQQRVEKALPGDRARRVQAFLRTIGLLPPTGDLKSTWLALLENQVGGYYDTDTKTMHLVARDGLPPAIERTVLAHELTHALDDQYADLGAFARQFENTTEDMDLATGAVIEGSATALMMQYITKALTAGRFDPAALQQYAKQETERSKPFLDAPRYFSAMLASYICGTQFLAKGQMLSAIMAPDDKAIGEALLAARKDPPKSSEQILHPDKYWAPPERRDEPVVVDDGAAERWLAQPGRWIVHADTVGEMLTAMLMKPASAMLDPKALQGADAWTNAPAMGWGGDRFYLLAAGKSRDTARQSLSGSRGVWVTAWDTPQDRDEFLAAAPHGSLAAGAVVVPVGSETAIVYFGFGDQERAALTKRVAAQPLPMTRGERPWIQ